MIQFGICNEIFKDWSIEDTFAFAAKIGYDAVEIAPFTIAKHVTDIGAEQRRKIKEAAARNRIAISGIHWVLVQTEGMYLTHPDAAVRRRTSEYFGELAKFCADLSGKTIVVGSPKQRNVMEGVTPEQAWDYATEVFREPVMRAEQHGVTICFEPLAPAETNFINTAEKAIQFVKQLNTPHFKIILDVKAMSSETKPIPRIIRESWPHFAYFHANDKNLKGPGFGDVDFRPIATALKEAGYNGVVSVEVFDFSEGPEVISIKSLEYLRKTFAGPPLLYQGSNKETLDSIWEFCASNRRLVPMPPHWNDLYKLLKNTSQSPSGGWKPPLPLILNAWHHTTPFEKQLRLKEHLNWAVKFDQIGEIGRFLRALAEEDWLHLD